MFCKKKKFTVFIGVSRAGARQLPGCSRAELKELSSDTAVDRDSTNDPTRLAQPFCFCRNCWPVINRGDDHRVTHHMGRLVISALDKDDIMIQRF